jgi:hypothetical protein
MIDRPTLNISHHRSLCVSSLQWCTSGCLYKYVCILYLIIGLCVPPLYSGAHHGCLPNTRVQLSLRKEKHCQQT